MSKPTIHKCNKEAEIAVIGIKMEHVEEKIVEMHKALMGNGKPGLIDEHNQFKGAVKTMKWVIGITIPLLALAVTVVGVMK